MGEGSKIKKREGHMLKRNQILLNDWLVDFIKLQSKKYGLSISEVVRAMLCLEFMKLIKEINPEYKTSFDETKTLKIMKDCMSGDAKSKESLHKYISDVYFEARKAMEYVAAKPEYKKNGKKE